MSRPTTGAPAYRAPEAPQAVEEASEARMAAPRTETAPTPASAPRGGTSGRPSSRLSASANEYRYVTLDLRRIAAVMGALFVAMIGLWVALDVAHVVSF